MGACQQNVYLNKAQGRGGRCCAMNWVAMYKGKALADKAAWVLIIKNIQ